MKTRNGFVTNSSSSSFIVSADKNIKKLNAKINIEFNLFDLLDTKIENYKELEDYFYKYYLVNSYFELEEDEKQKWDDYMNIIESGKSIYIFSASNEGSGGIEDILYYNGIGNLQIENSEIISYEC